MLSIGKLTIEQYQTNAIKTMCLTFKNNRIMSQEFVRSIKILYKMTQSFTTVVNDTLKQTRFILYFLKVSSIIFE